MNWFTIIFLVAVFAHLAVQVWLSLRQIGAVAAHRNAVPQAFSGVVSAADHAKAADYTLSKQRLAIIEAHFDAGVLIWLTVGGGISALGRVTSSVALPPLLAGTAQVLTVFAVLALLALPFSAYRTFVMEQRFGFNRTTVAVFVADLLKSWLLGAILGAVLVLVVLWVMRSAGSRWWLVAWAVWLAFSLLVTWAWPRLIAPLFNKFSRLENPALRARIDALLERCGFRASDVFVMDGSRRSAHGNAYFTGLGRQKRIVFFDTLIESLTPVQVESVLAHELGHFKLKHIRKRLIVGAISSLAGFALLGWLARQGWFYSGLGAEGPADATALLLFVFVVPAFTWALSPALAAWSRRHEYEADAFAARYSDGQQLAEALVSMYKDNASTLTPDPLYSAFHDSHPPPAARVERLRSLADRGPDGSVRVAAVPT